MRKLYVLLCFLAVSQIALGQDRTVTGKVSSADDGEPIPGVNVVLKGTALGTSTDLDGNYKVSVPADGGTLIFSFIGMKRVEEQIGNRSIIDVALTLDAQQLNEVIVTGIGVERQAKSLGYSTQNLDAEEITEAANTNLINSLQGKVAGVQINQSTGAIGGASRIVVRGPASLTNGNQPLFVIDGVPIDNAQRQSADLRGGPSFSNSGADINPDDIASMTVLKGPSAAALYGSRAANGVILITTKSGKGGTGKTSISVNSSITFDDVLRYPAKQSTYGTGSGGEYNPTGFSGWGPKIEGQTVFNPNNEWEGQPDSVSLKAYDQFLKQYLQTGKTVNNSVSVSGGGEKATYRMSFSNANSEGIVPNTDVSRTTASIKSGIQLANNFRSEVSATYTLTESDNIPPSGQTQNSFMWQALYTGVDLDISPWETYEAPDGSQLEYGSGFWNNPYWTVNKNRTSQRRDRVNGKVLLGYEFAEGIELIGRVGTDVFVDARKGRTAINTVGNVDGGFFEDQFVVTQLNTDVFLNVNRDLTDQFTLNGIIGINDNRRGEQRNFSEAGAIVVPDLYNFSNIDGQPNANNNIEERRLFGAYGSLNIGYKDWAFVDFTARNDWSSTLPKENNSFFYPSVSGSLILTEAVPAIENDYMTYLKLRGNWGQVGNDANPYVLNSVYAQGGAFDGLFDGIDFPFNGVTGFTAGDRIGTPDLQPEITTSWEIGAEIGFWKDRLTIDATYFDSKSTNQIFNVNIAPSSGYRFVTRNAGLMTNKGVELLLTGTPIRTNSGFRWDIQANWTKINNEVEELFADLEQLNVGRAGFVSVSSVAYLGQPYPVIYGRSWRRNDAGEVIVSPDTGLPILSTEQSPVAKVIPDWTGGIRNNFSFKGIDLSILFEMRMGGSLYSSSVSHYRVNGFAKETELGRESGIVFNGVNEVVGDAGDTTYVKNAISVGNEDFWSSFNLFGDTELGLVDASFIKLREVSLGYGLPKSLLEKTPFGSVYASVVGRNLWLNTPNPYLDPEVSMFGAADNQGYEYASIPSTKSWGFNLKFTF